MKRQKTYNLFFDVLTKVVPSEARSCFTFSECSHNEIVNVSILGICDVWSENRKAVGRALTELCSRAFTQSQAAITLERISNLLVSTVKIDQAWRECEGAVVALTSFAKRFVPNFQDPPGRFPTSFTFGRNSSLPELPAQLAVNETTFSALCHSQVRVREAALNYLRTLLKRAKFSKDVAGIIGRSLSILSSNSSTSSTNTTTTDGILSAISVLIEFLDRPSREGQLWNNIYSAALPFLSSPASTVRQRSAALIFGLATEGADKAVEVLTSLEGNWIGDPTKSENNDDIAFPPPPPNAPFSPSTNRQNNDINSIRGSVIGWQRQEGIMIAYESIFSHLFNNYLDYVARGENGDSPILDNIIKSGESKTTPFLSLLVNIKLAIVPIFSSPQVSRCFRDDVTDTSGS